MNGKASILNGVFAGNERESVAVVRPNVSEAIFLELRPDEMRRAAEKVLSSLPSGKMYFSKNLVCELLSLLP